MCERQSTCDQCKKQNPPKIKSMAQEHNETGLPVPSSASLDLIFTNPPPRLSCTSSSSMCSDACPKRIIQVTLRTPKTSWWALESVLILVRDRFLFGFTTTSPQCFGTVPDEPEVGRLGGDVWCVDTTGVVVSVLCDGTGDAEIGVWRVAWGRRCGCG